MRKSKSYAERVPFKRALKIRDGLRSEDWDRIENLAGLKFDTDLRDDIQMTMRLYSAIGPLYAPAQSVLASTAKKELTAWLNATNRLQKKLSMNDDEFTKLISGRSGNITLRTRSLTCVGQVALASYFAEATASNALSILNGTPNGRIDVDLWAAWAELLSRSLKAGGLKVAAASNNKSAKESPYIRVIQALQCHLPRECQRNTTYESVRVALGESRRQFRGITSTDLLQLLVGWGSQLLNGYPGNLLHADTAARDEFSDLARRTRKSVTETVENARNAKQQS